MERLDCGCLPSGAFEQQIVKAQREYNLRCDSCHTRNPHLCDIQTDLSIKDVRLAHGISLQRSYKLMQESVGASEEGGASRRTQHAGKYHRVCSQAQSDSQRTYLRKCTQTDQS